MYLLIPNIDLLTPDNAIYACQNVIPGNYNGEKKIISGLFFFFFFFLGGGGVAEN